MDEQEAALNKKIADIAETLAEAKTAGHTLSEADTEHIVIDPLLQALGYKPLQVRKRPYDKTTGTIPDYTLLPETPHKWFLEAKRLDLKLTDGEAAQAVNYATNQGGKWAVLTNGRAWFIYLAHRPVALPEKRLFQIEDLFSEDGAAKTLLLLSRTAMEADAPGKAWQARQIPEIARREIWTPGSELRRSLRRIAEKETGGDIADADIDKALSSLLDAPAAIAPVPAPAPPKPAAPAPKPAGNWLTLSELAAPLAGSVSRKPGWVLLGKNPPQAVNSWSSLTQAVVHFVGEEYQLPPLPFILGDKSKKYFLHTSSTRHDGQEMHGYAIAVMKGQKVFIDTHRSAISTIQILFSFLHALNVPADAIQVELKPVNTDAPDGGA